MEGLVYEQNRIHLHFFPVTTKAVMLPAREMTGNQQRLGSIRRSQLSIFFLYLARFIVEVLKTSSARWVLTVP